jgi:hypothetical protein
VLLASWVLAVCKGSRVTLARLARWESRVFLAFLAPLDLWVSRDLSDPRDSLGQSVCEASKVRSAPLVCVVLLVPLVLLVLSAFAARLDLLVSKARWVLLV